MQPRHKRNELTDAINVILIFNELIQLDLT